MSEEGLNDHDQSYDAEEITSLEQFRESRTLRVQRPAVKLVEDLEKDKGGEDHRRELACPIPVGSQKVGGLEQDKNSSEVETHSKDILPHGAGDERLCAADRRPEHRVLGRLVEAEREHR